MFARAVSAINRKWLKITGIFLVIFSITLWLYACTSGYDTGVLIKPDNNDDRGRTESDANLTISAAASLVDVMEEIKLLYEKDTGSNLDINYGSSGALQQQIKQGAPVDAFIMASQYHADLLQEKGFIINASRIDFLENSIVLIVPVSVGNNEISGFNDLNSDLVSTLAIGDPDSVPAGRYAMEALENMGLWGELDNKLVLAKNVRQVLNYVESGNVDAGTVFKTDAITTDRVVIVEEAPERFHLPIIYSAAIVNTTDRLEEAEQFLSFLQSEPVQNLFIKTGFTFTREELVR